MPTEKYKPYESIAYDKTPVQVKVRPGVRERLKTVDNWRNKLRQYIDRLIEEESGS
ncbi:MAG: hypothetical protein KA714_02535 [Limnoraphis sp. WC205]|jgi:hypothetical protein|nr:hypothetical protein [Limnoraphis sp. WC205]